MGRGIRGKRDEGVEMERIRKWGMKEKGRRSGLVGLGVIRGCRN